MKHFYLLIWLTVFSATITGQPGERLLVELSGGFGSGWWIYDRGSDQNNFTNTLGWDRTPHAVYLHSGISVLLRIDRFYFGAGLHEDRFLEDDIWAFEDGNPSRSRIPISDGILPFGKKLIILAVDAIRTGVYRLQPEFRYGTFTMETLHPDRDNFTDQRVWQIGIGNVVKSGRWELVFRPFYSAYQIGLIDQLNASAKHRIYHAGGIIAIRKSFF